MYSRRLYSNENLCMLTNPSIYVTHHGRTLTSSLARLLFVDIPTTATAASGEASQAHQNVVVVSIDRRRVG